MNYEIPQKLQIQPCAIKGEKSSLMAEERTFRAWLASMSVGGGYSKMMTNRLDIFFKYYQYICKTDDIYKKFFLCINEYKILETELSFFVRLNVYTFFTI